MDNTYSNSPIPKEDLEILSKEFSGFAHLYSVTLKVIKNDFVRSGLKPFLWQLLLVFLPYFLYICAGTAFVIFGFVTAVGGTQNTEDNLALIVIGFLVLLVLTLVLVFYLILVSLNLTVRKTVLLNDTTYTSIWSLKDKPTIRQSMSSIFLISLLIGLLGFVGQILVTPITFAVSIIDGATSNQVVSLVASTISQMISQIPTYVIISFFGYSQLYAILQKQGPINSIKSSFGLVKPYYFQNILRWLPLAVSGFVLSTLFYICVYYANFIINDPNFSSKLISILPESYDNLSLPIAVIIIVVFVSIAVLIFSTLYSIFVYYYSYVTYVNLQLLDSKKSPSKGV